MKSILVLLGLVCFLYAPLAAQTLAMPLTLGDAIAEAVARNPGVIAAVRQVDVARALRKQAAPAPLQLMPAFSLTPDVPGGIGTLQTASAAISQQFLPSGALSATRSQADLGVTAAGFGVAASRRDIALRTASNFYTLAGAQATVDVARQNVASSEELVRSARLRARAGAIGGFEVLRATVELRRVQSDLLRAQATQNTQRVALNTLLGRAPDAPTTVAQPPLSLPAPASPSAQPSSALLAPLTAVSQSDVAASDTAALAAQAVAADPLLQQLQAQISAQAARARASAALRRPALALGVGYQVARALRSGEIFGAPVLTSGVSIPIFDRGTISGAVGEAQAQQTVLEAQAQGRSREVQAEVATAIADISASQARLQFAQTSRTQAEQGLRIAQFGFRQGALGSLDVLSAKNAAVSARGEERQAADDLAAAQARLRIVLGVSTSSS